MSQPQQPACALDSMDLERLAATLFPVCCAPHLIERLARCWHEATRAARVMVALRTIDPNACLICRLEKNGATTIVQRSIPPHAPIAADELTAALYDVPVAPHIAASAAKIVGFEQAGKRLGGVILAADTRGQFDGRRLPLLTQWSTMAALQAALIANTQSVCAERGLVNHDKLEALAEFAAGAGHEINNPLATISGRVQLLLNDVTDPDQRRALLTIAGQALRIRDMIGDLMLFARPPQPQPQLCVASEILDEVLCELEERLEQNGHTLHLETEPLTTVWADRAQLGIVLSNVIINSTEALATGGEIGICLKSVSVNGRPITQFDVSDNGPGLRDVDRVHLFDPFYSGRPAGRRLGFGLSKCWRIVTNHGGWIDVDSQAARTVFRIHWPAEQPATYETPVASLQTASCLASPIES